MPLLVLWLGYDHKEATGTSLAAIAGVLAGTDIQQRISERTVARAFVVLLVASAAVLVF